MDMIREYSSKADQLKRHKISFAYFSGIRKKTEKQILIPINAHLGSTYLSRKLSFYVCITHILDPLNAIKFKKLPGCDFLNLVGQIISDKNAFRRLNPLRSCYRLHLVPENSHSLETGITRRITNQVMLTEKRYHWRNDWQTRVNALAPGLSNVPGLHSDEDNIRHKETPYGPPHEACQPWT